MANLGLAGQRKQLYARKCFILSMLEIVQISSTSILDIAGLRMTVDAAIFLWLAIQNIACQLTPAQSPGAECHNGKLIGNAALGANDRFQPSHGDNQIFRVRDSGSC